MEIPLYSYKVIILEDDQALNTLIDIKIKANGYETINCYTGYEAIEKIKSEKKVFLVTDYQLPDMSCLELINDIEEMNMRTPFIVITGNGDEKVAVDMMKMGAMDYVIKDIGFVDQLPAVLNRAMNHLEIKDMLKESQEKVKEREEKYRSIFENIQDVYFEIDMDGVILEISPSVNEVLYFLRSDLVGENLYESLIPALNKAELLNLLKEEKKLKDKELYIENKKKERILISMSFKLTEGDLGEKIIGIFRDITQRKRLEQLVLKSVVETEESERKRIAEDIHDGLGPLLSSIKLYLNMLESNKKTDLEKVEMLSYAKELLDEAVQNTRTIATHLMPPTLSDFGLIKAIRSFCSKIQMTNEFKIHYESNFEERLNTTVEVVVYRTVIELINNSMKYSNAENIYIDFKKDHGMLEIKYSDDGVGFDVEKYFDDGITKGHGVLSIKHRIQSLNGKITYVSKKGEGFKAHIFIDMNYLLSL